MKLSNTEIIILASSVLQQMRHIPNDCAYYTELDTLYDKLNKEISHAQDNRQKAS